MHVVLPPLVAAGPLLPPPPGWPLRQLSGRSMGTLWSLKAFTPLPDATLSALIEAELAHCIALFSPWQAESEISRLNAAPGEDHLLSDTFGTLLAGVLEIAAASGGASDPTLGAMVDLWGFGPPGPRCDLPLPHEIAAAQSVSGWQQVTFDPQTGHFRRPFGMNLDFSGSAKGLAVDRISAALTASGVGFHLIEIGGECYGRGLKADMQPWWVDIEAPATTDAGWRIALNGFALATSGDAQRNFHHAGRSYAHTIDPVTGAPVLHGPTSVSVIAEHCWQADALATALMVMAPAAARAFAKERNIAALLQYRDAPTEQTPAWRKMAEAP